MAFLLIIIKLNRKLMIDLTNYDIIYHKKVRKWTTSPASLVTKSQGTTMAYSEDRELEIIFFKLAKAEGFTIEEIADEDYMFNKIEIWLEMGLITQRESDDMQAIWGIE